MPSFLGFIHCTPGAHLITTLIIQENQGKTHYLFNCTKIFSLRKT